MWLCNWYAGDAFFQIRPYHSNHCAIARYYNPRSDLGHTTFLYHSYLN